VPLDTPTPNLKLIQSLWMGVDSLLADPTLPSHVPLARLVDPNMTEAMSETVLVHVLNSHRQIDAYRRHQTAREWRPMPQPRAQERRVGILGLGELGIDAARKLVALGFDVAGWSRRPKQLPGIECFSGSNGLNRLLERTEILVCLLPLTASTRGILNAHTLAILPRGATVINLARGGHIIDDDLLDALGTGQIGYAVLDVFQVEPLPREHSYWCHPRVTVTPHIAAITDPRTAVAQVVQNLRLLREGLPLLNLVDRIAGY